MRRCSRSGSTAACASASWSPRPHIEPEADGSGVLTIRASKTDPDGKGSYVWLSLDTMRRVHAWLEASGVESGPLFRRIAVERRRARDAIAPVPYDQIAGNTRNWRERLEARR